MKICFIAWTTFTHGGIPRVITTLANELCKRHDITILCLKKNPGNVYGLNLSKIELVSYEQNTFSKIRREVLSRIEKKLALYKKSVILKHYISIRYPLSYQRYIINFINNRNFDVTVAASGMEETIFLGGIKHQITCKTVGWLHGSYSHYYSSNKNEIASLNFKQLSEFFLMKLDKVVVLSKNDESEYLSNGIKAVNIYNSLVPVPEAKCSPEAFRIVYAGALSEVKGADLLVEGFRLFAAKNQGWRLDIFGEGPLKGILERKIHDKGLSERIAIHPNTSNIDDEYDHSSIFLFCSRYEGFGVVLLEAMNHGLPIVASDIPITRELLKDENVGLLYESGNPEALAEALLKMVNSDNGIYSKNGRKLVEAFTPQKISREWETMLAEFVQS